MTLRLPPMTGSDTAFIISSSSNARHCTKSTMLISTNTNSASEFTTLWRYTNLFIIIIIIFKAHQHKARGRKTRLDIQNYGCNGNLLSDHGVVERNRISSLQSHGKALEKECRLLGIFCDSGDTPANLSCELNGYLMPCTSLLLLTTTHVLVSKNQAYASR